MRIRYNSSIVICHLSAAALKTTTKTTSSPTKPCLTTRSPSPASLGLHLCLVTSSPLRPGMDSCASSQWSRDSSGQLSFKRVSPSSTLQLWSVLGTIWGVKSTLGWWTALSSCTIWAVDRLWRWADILRPSAHYILWPEWTRLCRLLMSLMCKFGNKATSTPS